MDATLIFPNQLFRNHPALKTSRTTYLIQDPLFFGDKHYPLSFHKQKILLHLLTMDEYETMLKSLGYEVQSLSFLETSSRKYLDDLFISQEIHSIHLCQVDDFLLKKRITNSANKLNVKINWHDSPGFILGNSEALSVFTGKNSYRMSSFYKSQRKRLGILVDDKGSPTGGKWSFDAENRKKLPKSLNPPDIIKFNFGPKMKKNKEVIDQYFPNNLGTLDNFNTPVTHDQAKIAFEHFLKNRFRKFGDYEDAISRSHPFIFHSILSPYMNIGLITPKEVINMTLDYAKDNHIPLNSLEGFLRQVIGWREFVRGIYLGNSVIERTRNFWNFDRSMPKSFYDGTTGLIPFDEMVKNAHTHAYSHHIERLMIAGNLMVLCEIHPDEVYKWFMEFFIDAYDWVMVPNVYGMSQFADGGLFATKPYISGSNYLLKMSDHRKDEWCGIWDALYWRFIDKHRDFFAQNPRMKMMVSLFDKKTQDQKELYHREYTNFISRL